MLSAIPVLAALATLAPVANAHVAFWHNSMFGFNVTDNTFSYDNRPQVPLYSMTYDQWWLHGHKDYPPDAGAFFELPANGRVNTELSCDKGATSWYASSQGGNVGYGSNSPCPGAQTSAFHTTGEDDVKGCALAIAYKSDVNDLKPDDLVVFSVNHKCVWTLNTEFEVPQLPACPDGGCLCTFNWIHSIDSGSEQIYQNAFRCKVTGDVGTKALGTPAVPRRCGSDPSETLATANPGNCTVGAKTAMYWYQKDGNNMFEDTYHAPYYNDLYGFSDGPQTDIFENGVIASLASFGVSKTASSTNAATSTAATTAKAATTTEAATTTKAATTAEATSTKATTTAEAASTKATTTTEAASTQAGDVKVASTSSEAASTSATASCRRRSSDARKRDLAKKHARHFAGHH
ncbi:uncharacterized protein BXZ73DRAFT_96427 [Epithele typhae]|uniref:uncharacterized protein n=1 Tax=Epithele typhae TaxID=378194 RepID=UPI00200830DC|nr:uncharacterized protein BXZ73DRAFT_96427 [Epithele typhae]KAH9945439.1 hypothetical protein BXZ73DRAFT_96427 [Epithele typhae]